ncbi:MAG: hypothetical protein ACMUHU_07670 [Thermoplasmatota archaeon]
MPKKVKKKPVRTIAPSLEMSSDLRSFLAAFPNGFPEQALEDLSLYIDAFYNAKLDREELLALLEKERLNVKKAGRALYIEKKLLTPEDRILLGSCYCPACTRFKNFRKECPHCGNHEMTI